MADGGIMEAALMSAAIGGGTSLATGQDPLKGALLGAVTGGALSGIGGLMGGSAGALPGAVTNSVTPTIANAATLAPTIEQQATQAIAGAIGNPVADLSSIGAFGNASLTPSISNFGNLSGASQGIAAYNPNAASMMQNLGTQTAPTALSDVATPFVSAPLGTSVDEMRAIQQGAQQGVQQAATPAANPLSNGIRNLANIKPDDTGYMAKGLNYYDTLSPLEKGIGGVGVGYGYGALTAPPPSVPEIEKYKSKLAGYDRNTFTPTDPQQPSPYYTARYAEGGGIAALAGPQGSMYPQSQQANTQYATPSQMPTSSEMLGGYEAQTNPYTGEQVGFAQGGGIGSLGGYAHGGNPQLLDGPGDGMSDSIPASIGNKQPARLAQGEFVVPADVVSHLGNGSTDAGAKHLYAMMANVRKARTGNKKQGTQINPSKYLV